VRDLVAFDLGGKPCLAAVCLDRYLRVYSLEQPSLLHKVHLAGETIRGAVVIFTWVCWFGELQYFSIFFFEEKR